MSEPQTHMLKPGDHLNIINRGATALRVKIVTACGTETLAGLHPGAKLELTVGTSPARVDVLDVDENYTGLRLVR